MFYYEFEVYGGYSNGTIIVIANDAIDAKKFADVRIKEENDRMERLGRDRRFVVSDDYVYGEVNNGKVVLVEFERD